MTTPATAELRKTALNAATAAWAPKWSISAAGICRSNIPASSPSTSCAHARRPFDVSHMGEIEIRGPQRSIWCSGSPATTPRSSRIGQAHYSGLMTERGTFVDDLLVHKISDAHYLLCVNAEQSGPRFRRTSSRQNRFGAEVENAGRALFAARRFKDRAR